MSEEDEDDRSVVDEGVIDDDLDEGNAEENEQVDEGASEVTFNTGGRSTNNNATTVRPTIGQEDKNQIIGEAIGQAVEQVKNLIANSGFLETASMLQEQMKRQEAQLNQMARGAESTLERDARIKKKDQSNPGKKGTIESNSEVTVYRNAILNAAKRNSSSSEEGDQIDTSDENIVDFVNVGEINRDNEIDKLIADQRKATSDRRPGPYVVDGQRPSTSRQGDEMRERESPESRATNIIQQAEKGKARIYETPGELNIDQTAMELDEIKIDYRRNFVHSAMVDEHYSMVGTHLDEQMKNKIIKCEYVDFSKLIAKDKVTCEEEGSRYQMAMQAGKQFWSPVNEGTNISSFSKWEQAFRVYSNVYLKAYPHRAAEIVQYNHLIHTAAQEFIWPNVYQYDKDFRIHMAAFPSRSWAIILLQAWTIRLREKIRSDHHNFNQDWSKGDNNNNRDKTCRRFNKGRCTYGANCKWEHKCKYCKKWGHGMFNCRKFKAEKSAGTGSSFNSPQADRGHPDGKVEKPSGNAEKTVSH